VTLKLVTRAVQIIEKTSGEDLISAELRLQSMILIFIEKVKMNRFFVHEYSSSLDAASLDF
jgi:hypothetical protein